MKKLFAILLLFVSVGVAGHEIPSDVTVRVFIRPAEDRLELLDEVVDVLELAVHRSKADERHLVHIPQATEYQFADFTRGNLTLEALVHLTLDRVDDPLDLVVADRSLVAGLLETHSDPLAVKRNPRAILLDHPQRRFLDLLIRRESPLATQALAAAADRCLIGSQPRVDNFTVRFATGGTFHG